MNLRSHFPRWHSPSVFTLIALCFLLPFATVTVIGGCGAGPDSSTTFTGAQLVTHTVPKGGWDSCGRDISVCVEQTGATAATVALGAAIVGLLLGLLGIERGPGWCASVGLGALVVIPGRLYDHEVSLGAGYGLALLLFAWAGLLHLIRARNRTHPDPSTDRSPLLWGHPLDLPTSKGEPDVDLPPRA